MLNPEFLPYQDSPNASIVNNFINYGANHEAKTVVSDVYLQQPGELLTPVSVARSVTAWQGVDPIWKVPIKDIIQYTERSLEKGGIVEPGRAMGERGHEVTAWAAQASPDDLLVQRAMVGLYANIGVEFPLHSVQRLYRLGGIDRSRAPLVRHRVYDLLLDGTSDHSIKSLNSVLTKEGHHPSTLNRKLEALDEEGIIEVGTKFIGYNPSMKIVENEYKHVAIRFSDTSLETQAAYAAAQDFGINTTVGVEEFVDKAIEKIPDADPIMLRRYIMGSFSAGTNHFPGLQLVDRLGLPVTDLSVVKLSPEAEEPVREIVTAVRKILAGEGLQSYAKQAQKIMDDPSKVRMLIQKAGDFSALKAGHFHGSVKLTNQMRAILQNSPHTAESMRLELLEKHGRMIGHGRIHSLLNSLVETEGLGESSQPVHPHSAISQKLYGFGL